MVHPRSSTPPDLPSRSPSRLADLKRARAVRENGTSRARSNERRVEQDRRRRSERRTQQAAPVIDRFPRQDGHHNPRASNPEAALDEWRQPTSVFLLPVCERQSVSRSCVLSRYGDTWCRSALRDETSTRDLCVPAGCADSSHRARGGWRSRGTRLSGAGPGEQDRVGRVEVGGAQRSGCSCGPVGATPVRRARPAPHR